MDISRLMTRSMKSQSWGLKSARIMEAALNAVNPQTAVLHCLKREDTQLEVNREIYDLNTFDRVLLVGAGKAGQPMSEGVQEVLGDRLNRGLVIVKEGYKTKNNLTGRINIVEARHPIPDIRGVKGTDEVIELLENTSQNDLVICLISGGGSALLVSPVPGVSLQDLQRLTEILLASGATINEINTLRKHLDRIKGGQLARFTSPAKLISLILSDVVGDPLDVIASGPTVPDGTTFKNALAILEHYQIEDQIPAPILEYLKIGEAGMVEETPKPGEQLFAKVNNIIVGSNRTASQAALEQGLKEGFNTCVLSNFLQGEASQVGKFLATILRQVAIHNQPIPRPACIIVGGETTVTLRGDGLGGRNQEIALGSVEELDGLDGIALITLATDGGDGPSDAAGAVVTGKTLKHALTLDLDPQSFLARNDAYNFFDPLGDLLKTGPTQTNVNDLAFLFAFE
ncbi:MAG: glycerate kinase [Chloroflexi bacterium]|nr:glycerate kinase [Chloroflexota bacterium]